jgi:transcriptional regulator with XRE-family HTH domain
MPVYALGSVYLSRLREWRRRRGLSQADLSDMTGLSRATISRLETGHEEPYPATIRKLADALHVRTDQLMEPADT